MDSIGAQLQQERERRSLSREDVAESTKITVQNLAAIEEDRFDYFPNRVYARAFLRDYANFLGLDSGELLDRYEQERAGAPEPAEPAPEVRVSPKRRWRAVGVAALLLGIAACMALVAFVAYNESLESRSNASRHRHGRVQRVGALPKPTPPKPEPVSAPASSSTVTSQPAEPAKPAQPAQPSQPTPSDRVTIKLTALGSVWVSVKVDGQTKLYTIIPKGTTQTFEGKTVVIRAGRGNAIQIERDGKKSLLWPEGVPKTQVYVPAPAAQSPQP